MNTVSVTPNLQNHAALAGRRLWTAATPVPARTERKRNRNGIHTRHTMTDEHEIRDIILIERGQSFLERSRRNLIVCEFDPSLTETVNKDPRGRPRPWPLAPRLPCRLRPRRSRLVGGGRNATGSVHRRTTCPLPFNSCCSGHCGMRLVGMQCRPESPAVRRERWTCIRLPS